MWNEERFNNSIFQEALLALGNAESMRTCYGLGEDSRVRRTKLFRYDVFASRLSEIPLCLHYDYQYVKFMNSRRQQLEENRNVTVFDLIEM